MKMKDVDQTNPHTNEAFGQSFHGPWPVTDGGQPQRDESANGRTERRADRQTMADVEHEAATAGATRSFQRGAEDEEEEEDEDETQAEDVPEQ